LIDEPDTTVLDAFGLSMNIQVFLIKIDIRFLFYRSDVL